MLDFVGALHRGSGSTLTPVNGLAGAHGATLALLPSTFGPGSTFDEVAVPMTYEDAPFFSFKWGAEPHMSVLFVDPAFPNAHRLDLPQHERKISAEALALLHRGIEDVRAGRVRRLTDADLGEPDELDQ